MEVSACSEHHRGAMNTQSVDVALILWNPDVIEWVSFVLAQLNLKCCGIEPSAGIQNIEQLIASRAPGVVVFDLEPPYQRSSAVFFQLLDRFPDRAYLVTCADPTLAVKAAPWLVCHIILQKPYAPDVIGKVVVSASNRASLRLPGGASLDLHATCGPDLFVRDNRPDRFPGKWVER
jgi:hypothetical protein